MPNNMAASCWRGAAGVAEMHNSALGIGVERTIVCQAGSPTKGTQVHTQPAKSGSRLGLIARHFPGARSKAALVQLQQRLDCLVREHQDEVDSCQQVHSEALAKLGQVHENELTQSKLQHQNAVTTLEASAKNKLAADAQDWRDALDQVRARLDAAEAEVDKKDALVMQLHSNQMSLQEELRCQDDITCFLQQLLQSLVDECRDKDACIAQLQQQLQDKSQESSNKDNAVKLMQRWLLQRTTDLAAAQQEVADLGDQLAELQAVNEAAVVEQQAAAGQLQQLMDSGAVQLRELQDRVHQAETEKLQMSQQLQGKSEEAETVKAKLVQYNKLLSLEYEGDARVQHVLRECTVNNLAALCIERKAADKLLPQRCLRVLNPETKACVLFELEVARGDRKEKQVAKAVPVSADDKFLNEVQVEATNAAVCQRHGARHLVHHSALVVRPTTYCVHSKKLLSSPHEAEHCSCATCTATRNGAVWAHMLMEPAQCDLWAAIDKREQYTAIPAAKRIRGAASFGMGLVEMHRANVIHGDVKTAQALLPDASDVTHVKVADFDNSRLVVDASRLSPDPLPGAGTRQFMAPEVFFDDRISAASDVVGFALTAVEAVTGRDHAQVLQGLNLAAAYQQGREAAKAALDPRDLAAITVSPQLLAAAGIPEALWAQLWAVLRPCLRFNPGQRPELAQVVADLLALAQRWEVQ